MLRHHGSRLTSSVDFLQVYTARFVPLFLHLTLLILVFVFRDDLVNNCSSNDSTAYVWSDTWTGVSLALVCIEMSLALSGLSIFRHYAVVFSIVLHSTGCVLLSAYFMTDMSICLGSPYLLFFCTFLPLMIELISWIELFVFDKKL